MPSLSKCVDGSKDRGSKNVHDRLHEATSGLNVVEFGLQIAVFLFYRGPGAAARAYVLKPEDTLYAGN